MRRLLIWFDFRVSRNIVTMGSYQRTCRIDVSSCCLFFIFSILYEMVQKGIFFRGWGI